MVDQLQSFIMTKDEFKDFLKILNFFSDGCNDLHVVDGKVLQRTNDRLVAIRCDLSNLIKFDGEVKFWDIKKMVNNIKTLHKDSPIRFRRVGNTMRIKDPAIAIDIPLGDNVFIDNQKISEDEFDRIFNWGPMILESEMDKNLCESLKKCAKIQNKLTVTLSIRTNRAILRYGESNNKDTTTEFNFSYKLMTNMPDRDISLSTIAFNLRSASTLKIYFDQNNNDIALVVFTIPFNNNIIFELYQRVTIRKVEEVED